MSLYDKSSLVLIPSGTKTGKVFSQKPVSGDGDFTFTRASAATRVNADGNIEKETQNLLTYSNAFDQWSDTTIVLTSGQSGYDGSNNAWLMAKNGSNSRIFNGVTTSGITTTSVYAKANASNYLRVRCDTTNATSNTYFNLSNGTIYSTIETIDEKIEDVGGGWYRCSVVPNDPTTIVRLYPAEAGSTSDVSGSIYIQDAQVEQGLVARDYIETTTAAVYGGITDNTPRLDYTDSSCPSLKLEPQRTNGNTNSEYFSGTGFGIVAATATPNVTTSPEGVDNATSLIGSTSSAQHIIYTTGSSTYNGDTTISIFAKANGYDYFVLGAGAQSTNKPVLFNIANGTKVGNFTGWGSYGAPIDSDIEDYGNGWYRLWVTFAATSGANTNMFFGSMPTDSVASGTTIQNGTDGSYIYGAQIEAGSYATSYIPTYGSSVSRVNESSQILNIQSVIGGLEGTIFFDIKTNKTLTSTNYKQFFYYSDSSSAQAYMYISGNNYIVGNPNLGNIVSGQKIQADTRYKIAVTYKANDFKLYINGSLSATRTSGNVIDAVDITSIGSYNGVSEFNEFKFNSYMHFQQVLSNEELAALTTI
jgi:hypothetical protein